ncbi:MULTISPECIES: hypothetical protein [Halobacterium]|uniref:hypothetical protein n=1 Tax=Halobacterium TaxID=2239 RepID=UPI001E416CE7|nr:MULTISPECIES: hypothetical protein [Halobacterium]MDL0122965.1 hypothetical protein [Halobacterium salinarum]MDL0125744.1 hypothetical protein [Halobacterium salinarum]QRY25797.2 hypothetical protein JRZ79_05190 [Halobacterium sp. BOL4-2]
MSDSSPQLEDQRTDAMQALLYMRDDVAARTTDVDAQRYLDNERYGFITRATYNRLHYATLRYTHRGFDTWELFRTFLDAADGTSSAGVVIGLDADGTCYDFDALTDTVHAVGDEHSVAALTPATDEPS